MFNFSKLLLVGYHSLFVAALFVPELALAHPNSGSSSSSSSSQSSSASSSNSSSSSSSSSVSSSSSSLSSASSSSVSSTPCCSPVYVRSPIGGRCIAQSTSLARKLIKERVKEILINQGCTGVRISVASRRTPTQREDVGLKNLVNVSRVGEDPYTFQVNSINMACSVPTLFQISTRFRDRYGVLGARKFQSSIMIPGEYR